MFSLVTELSSQDIQQDERKKLRFSQRGPTAEFAHADAGLVRTVNSPDREAGFSVQLPQAGSDCGCGCVVGSPLSLGHTTYNMGTGGLRTLLRLLTRIGGTGGWSVSQLMEAGLDQRSVSCGRCDFWDLGVPTALSDLYPGLEGARQTQSCLVGQIIPLLLP